MKPSSRRAFSLVELLAVLAIVAVLAVLLMSVFSRVRQQGEKTACASNLRQLANAMHLYLQDNGGAFPIERIPVVQNGVSASMRWSDRLKRTIPIQEVIHCPAVPASARWGPNSPDYHLGRDVSTSARPEGRLRFQSQFPQPTTTELFGESVLSDGGVLVTGRRIASRCGVVGGIFNLHLDGANIAYLDGHVKWMSADAQAQREEVCGW